MSKPVNSIMSWSLFSNSLCSNEAMIALLSNELENKDQLINELTGLLIEKNHPDECNQELLDNLFESIQSEKNRIFEEDTLDRSLEGKSPLEQARILSEYNRRKAKKNAQKKEDR